MKRAKLVFRSDEIPHLWAHKVQSEGRNAQGNLYFENETIYSYGSHFPIARHVTNGKKQTAILVTTRGHSVTTSKHISMVRRAIPSGTVIFRVPNVSDYHCHAENLKTFEQQSENALRKATRSRSNATSLLQDAFDYCESAKGYAEFFAVKRLMPKFAFLPKAKTLDGLKEQFKAQDAKQTVKNVAQDKKRAKRYAELCRIQSLEIGERLTEWCNGASVETWSLQGADTALRIVGDTVETSRGANVPISHAITALALVRRVMERQEEFVTNGRTIHVGHYKLDRIAIDGTIYVGCHVIKWDAINRIAPALDVLARPIGREAMPRTAHDALPGDMI